MMLGYARLKSRATRIALGATSSAVALGLTAAPAHAAVIACTTSVNQVAVTPNGTLIVGLDGIGWPYLCNVNGPQSVSIGSISAETCKTWVSKFLTAKASHQNITFNIDYGSSAAPSSCGALTNFNWQYPSPFPYWISFGG